MTARRLAAPFASTPAVSGRPFYARVLRLQHLNPSSTLCFVFLEGATALAIILALAELIPLWGTVLLPLCIAAMVKINDLVAGAAVRAAATGPGRRPMRPLRPFRTIGRATVPGGAGADKVGRVYRSAPAEAAAPAATNKATKPTDPTDPVDPHRDQTATAEHAGWSDGAPPTGDGHRVIHGGATPSATRATAVNSPPVDLHQSKAARTPTAHDWAADVCDTPAQRARHAATRRYE
ncbi:hypothetical protein DFJ67_0208 [Asanoa ferruginea]|uniref:Uncharacterized protein n=1 Tax=Asanoa ferruginea TaxID=53367 RepID=A0A3D9ZAC9_9ACTN|nr:hypothetical protein [Asanoa ferruginea]REF94291.1 hypothetical protein DFJ67_0208 [Asanoa ferruginea]GIF53148.1 hypothetical protein Afe04nite_76870 [Asanoa ferruginea]